MAGIERAPHNLYLHLEWRWMVGSDRNSISSNVSKNVQCVRPLDRDAHIIDCVRPLQSNFKFNANGAWVAEGRCEENVYFCNQIHRTEINLMSIGTTDVTTGLSHVYHTRREWCTRLTKYTNRPRSIEKFHSIYYFLIIHSDQFQDMWNPSVKLTPINKYKIKNKHTLAIAISHENKNYSKLKWYVPCIKPKLTYHMRTKRLCVLRFMIVHTVVILNLKMGNKASGKVVSNGTTFRTLLTVRRIAMVRYGRAFACRCDAHAAASRCGWFSCCRSLSLSVSRSPRLNLLFHWLPQKFAANRLRLFGNAMKTRCTAVAALHTDATKSTSSSNNKCDTTRMRTPCIGRTHGPCVPYRLCGKRKMCCLCCIRNHCYAYEWFIELRLAVRATEMDGWMDGWVRQRSDASHKMNETVVGSPVCVGRAQFVACETRMTVSNADTIITRSQNTTLPYGA